MIIKLKYLFSLAWLKQESASPAYALIPVRSTEAVNRKLLEQRQHRYYSE